MQAIRESKTEKEIRKYIKRLGGEAYKFVSPGNAGVPDRLVILPQGRVCFIECKRKGEKLRAIQAYQKQQIEKLGVKVLVIDDIEDLKNAIPA